MSPTTLTAVRNAALESIIYADPDPVRDALLTAVEDAPSIREKHGKGVEALKVVAKLLDDCPRFMLASTYADIEVLDLATMAHTLIDELPEFAAIRGYPIRFVWQRKASTGRGQMTLGTCRVTGNKERLLWEGDGPCPWWEITIALDAWLLANNDERMWLLHHEASHASVDVDDEGEASPSSKGHDVEEFYSSAGRFGPKDAAALRLARHTLSHPNVAERAEAWGIDADGQGVLFAPYEKKAA